MPWLQGRRVPQDRRKTREEASGEETGTLTLLAWRHILPLKWER